MSIKTKNKLVDIHGQLNLTASVWKEDPLFVARCNELKITSQGENPAIALSNLEEAIELYLEDETLENIIVPLKFSFTFNK